MAPLVLLLLVLVHPAPYAGVLSDDFQYLSAAHCWACLPTTHWEQRFLIVWPTAAALALFGSNIWSVMAFPLACGLAAVWLLYDLTRARYGHTAGIIASVVLALTPIFTERAMRIGVDVPEFALLLGALWIIERRHWQGWAGALVGIAVITRPTELPAAAMIGVAAWLTDRRQVKWYVTGILAPVAVQMGAFAAVTGDPLYAWKLSLHHTEVFSQMLSPNVDRNELELFNPHFIGGWRPSAHIHAHWTVQGILNLLADRNICMTLWCAMLFTALRWRELDKLQIALIVCAALDFGALTYGFAVDPRPRMFMPVIAIAAVLIGSLSRSLWEGPWKAVVVSGFGLIAVGGCVGVLYRQDFQYEATIADRLLTERPYRLTKTSTEALSLKHWGVRGAATGPIIVIDYSCPSSIQGRRMTQRTGKLCIYG